MDSQDARTHVEERIEDEAGDDRREFLKKCGRFAAYTAPVVVTLLHYDRAHGKSAPTS